MERLREQPIGASIAHRNSDLRTSLYKSLPAAQRRLTVGAQTAIVFSTIKGPAMNSPSEPTSTMLPRRTFFNRMTAVAFVAGVALAGGIAAVAGAAGMGAGGWHHGMSSGHGPADVSAHVDHMLKHLFVEVDATDAQQAQITPLVKQAMADLMP